MNNIYGYWRIVEMEVWDQDFIDAEVEGHFEFTPDNMGRFQFGYVEGFMDCRYKKVHKTDKVEFSWDGNDEMTPASGRGEAVIEGNELVGRIYIHNGDDSEFTAVRL